MKFVLNGQELSVDEPDPCVTLLRYLRTGAGCVGVKEGCASGDCGACTVLLGKPGEHLSPINSCITPLGAVDGAEIVTVEGLAKGEDLHPAQEAMVTCHGSQCGFCTPGFVMSLAAMYERAQTDGEQCPPREHLVEGISGNLCRCTGYRPILDAGEAMFAVSQRPLLERKTIQVGAKSGGEAPPSSVNTYLRPLDEQSLQKAMADNPGAPLVAGSTDWCLQLTQNFEHFPTVIDLNGVSELSGVKEEGDTIWLGAITPYSELLGHPLLGSQALDGLLARFGSPQIRRRGTVGGNLANGSPIADMPPVLLAWDAEVMLRSANGEERRVKLTDFYHGYRQTELQADEYLAAISIPLDSLQRPHRFFKLTKRYEDDISSVMLALSARVEAGVFSDVRVAFGGMAAVPVRLQAIESEIESSSLSEALLDSVSALLAEQLAPISDVRASARYRLAMADSLLRKGLSELAGQDPVDLFSLPRTGVSYA